MNLKKFLSLSVVLMLVLFTGLTSAQATFYVNNQNGDDANSGTTVVQAKKTVASALIAAPDGSTISVAITGINYTEGDLTLTTLPVVSKNLTFTTSGVGTAHFVNANLIVDQAGGVKFTGAFEFGNLTLTAGAVTGASNLTFRGNVTRTAGTVDSQIKFTAGAHNFVYNGIAPITSGFELPAASNTTNFGNLNTAATAPLTLNESKTMNGVLTTGSTLALGGNTLTIVGASAAHAVGDNVSGGTLAFTLTGAAGVAGNFNLPNITATKSTGGVVALTLATAGTIGNVSASGNASVLADAAFTLGDLTNTGAGQISGDAATTVGAVSNTSTVSTGNVELFQTSAAATTVASVSNTGAGYVLLNNPAAINLIVTGAISQSGAGYVSVTPILGVGGTVSVGGTVTNNPGLTLTAALVAFANNVGVIRFGDRDVTVTGLLTVGTTFTGSATWDAGAGSNTLWSNAGEISFASTGTLVTLTGGVNVSSSSSFTEVDGGAAGGAVGFANNGGVTFANTTGDIVSAGGFNVSSNFVNGTNVPRTGNGSIVAADRTTGTVGTAGVRTGAIVNTSTSSNGSYNGDISFGYVTYTPTVVTGGLGTTLTIGTHNLIVGASIYISGAGDVALDGGILHTVTATTVNTITINNAGAAVANAAMPPTSRISLPRGDFFGTSVTQGPGADGGDILFGDHVINLSGSLLNKRTVAGADIISTTTGTARAQIVAGDIINSGKSNIDLNLTSASTLALTGKLENTGTGSIEFTAASGGAINLNGGINISAGKIEIPASHSVAVNVAKDWVVSGGTLNILGTGVAGSVVKVSDTSPSSVSWTDGTINFTGKLSVTIGSLNTVIGAAITNPSFTSITTELIFDEPIPNQLQTVQIGGASPVYPGPLSVKNNANIPAPVVVFKPIAGLSVANLYVTNNVKFDNGLVLNATKLDGVRLNVGKNGAGGGNGNFQNTTGYTTTNGGYVMMSGHTAAQTVNAIAPTAGATFGNFGVDNDRDPLPLDIVPEVTFVAGISVFTGDFYLAEGGVNLLNTQFNGTAPWPTVFRTEGEFQITPPNIAAGTKINVTYYGGDKATALEIPVGTTLLWNLTVSTTNGAVSGKGVVTMGGVATVNGTLTIDANQHLYTNAKLLTIAGAAVVLNGHLVDSGLPFEVALASPTGTAFTGTGSVPSIQINNGSLGNTLVLPGLVSDAFGADNALGGGDDFFTTYDGNITYEAGADAGSALTVTFSAAGPNFADLTFADGDVDQTFTLGSNAIMSGDIAQAGGNINLGGFTLTHNGTAPGMTVGGTITNGLLKFVTAATNFFVTGPGTAVIGANFEYADATDNNVAQAFTFLTGSTGNLQINGTLTLSATTTGGDGAQFDIGAGRTLTAGGNVTVGSGSSFLATNGGTTGILLLDAVTAPLVYSTPANSAVANLTVADDVNLTGGIASSTLTVGTAMIHNAGAINIGSANLRVGNAGVATYTRIAGTYTGTGYFIWDAVGAGTAWNHGPAVTYPKLQVAQALNVGATGMVTVADELYLKGFVLTATTAGVNYLTIGDANGALVQVAGLGNMNAAAGNLAPAFVGQTDYLFTGASSAPNTNTWPTSQATNVTLNTVAAQSVTVVNSRTILGDVDLTVGTLEWDSPVVITLTDGKTVTRRLNASKLNRDATLGGVIGGLVAGNINLAYQQTVAADVITTDIEYSIPTVVNNFSLLASTAVAPNTTEVTIGNGTGFALVSYARTIAGTLSMASILNINVPTVWTLAQTVPAGSFVNSNANTTWTGPLTVAGTYVNAAVVTSSGAVTATGTFTNNGTFNAAGLSSTGTTNLAGGSTLNLTGDATINNATVGVAAAVATINTPNNLIFTGTLTNTGLNLNFTGTNAQTVALGANRTINNLTLNKGNDQTVTFSGGNIVLQGAVAPNGVLTLTRGVLAITDPFVITLNPTVAGGFITGLGYVRNPANAINLAHVKGKVGVAVPVNTLGRMEWPVGSDTKYRPAAITFTVGNATIAPTTIVVGHFDTTPTGDKNFAIDGGTKFADPSKKLWISGKAPYYWSFEATTSLGAAQKFDVELNGTNLQRPLENHNDLRIIRRFDGDVSVNGWFLEGAGNSYSNAMAEPQVGDTVLVVRNIGSLGSAIAQKAIFTIGIPSGLPVFTAVAPAAVTTPEMVEYTFDFNAVDQDVNSTGPTFSLVTPPAGAVIDPVTGVFKWKPTYAQGSATAYPVTVRATKPADATVYADYAFAITVTNVNRLPSFDSLASVKLANKTIKVGETVAVTYVAIDPDGGVSTYALTSVTPAPATAPTLSAAGAFSFTAGLADVGKDFVVVVTATDADGGTTTTTATIKVVNSLARGDADADGTVLPADAAKILAHVVGNITLTGEALWAADANQDGTVTSYDAYYVLYFYANQTWPLAKMSAAMGTVQFNNLVAQEGGSVLLPINLSNTTGVVSVYAEIELGSNVNYNGLNTRLPEGWMVTSNYADGILKVAMVGVTPLTDGDIANVSLKLNNKESLVDVTANAKLNDDLNVTMSAKVREIP
ncbi:MAG: dockerin type I domain-containing protein, partial [Melioribacteraceae bacterium]